MVVEVGGLAVGVRAVSAASSAREEGEGGAAEGGAEGGAVAAEEVMLLGVRGSVRVRVRVGLGGRWPLRR